MNNLLIIFSRKYWPYITNRLVMSAVYNLSTMYCKISASWWGVNFGYGCRFHGKTYFRIKPGGSVKIGSGCVFNSAFLSNTIGLKQKCILWAGKRASIIIGDNCGFSGTAIHAKEKIILGNKVLCGANVTITDTDVHPIDPVKRRNKKDAPSKPVIIGDDVWLGMNVVVLKGVTIGYGTVVAANSVVTKDIPPMVVAAGLPAKIVKKIES